MIRQIKTQLENANMPIFWQVFALLHLAFVILVFIFANEFWRNILYPIVGFLIVIGVSTGINQQTHMRNLWYLLITGILLFELSIILQSLIYFGLPIDQETTFYIKQIGVVFASIFTLGAMLFLEKKYQLKGLVVDFSLIAISLIIFFFIAKPSYLNSYLFEFSISEQLYLLNIAFGILLIIMGVLHLVLSKHYELKSILLITTIFLFVSHFTLELLQSFDLLENKLLASKASWFFYQFAGSFAISYSFLEKFELKFSQQASSQLSELFMWLASILAILTVPIATLLSDALQVKTSFFYLITSFSGLILGGIVIWRFIILIRNSNKQRKKLKNIAHTDELTNVLNYLGYCEKYLSSNLPECLVISMDIDDFKSINDLYGRDFGDDVLVRLAKRLRQLNNVKIVARIGPDNFITVFQTRKNMIQEQLKTLQKDLGIWHIVQERRIAVPITFGASHTKKFTDIEVLTRQAEKALKTARNKRIRFSLYTDNNNDKHLPRLELRGILQQAVDSNFLPVHFQPIYDLHDGSLKALELLIRIQSIQHGLILPDQFLEQAKSYGLLTPLTKVCVNMIAQNYHNLPKVIININLPPYMLENPRILNEFLISFKEAKLSPQRFCIEVTEDENIPPEHLLDSVKRLKKIGFSIAMDDFGTGYSSLARLSMLPFDTVKIDRSILLAASSGNNAILESTIKLIQRLGLSVVVEGVETSKQLSLVQRLGADSVQGFLLSKPVDTLKAINLPLNAANIISEF